MCEGNKHGKFSDKRKISTDIEYYNTGPMKMFVNLKDGSKTYLIDSIERAVESLSKEFAFRNSHGFLNKVGNLVYLTFWGFLPKDYKSIDFYKDNHLDGDKEQIESLLFNIFEPFLEDVDSFNLVSIDATIDGIFMFLVCFPELTKENLWSIHDGLLNTGFKFDIEGAMFFSKKGN